MTSESSNTIETMGPRMERNDSVLTIRVDRVARTAPRIMSSLSHKSLQYRLELFSFRSVFCILTDHLFRTFGFGVPVHPIFWTTGEFLRIGAFVYVCVCTCVCVCVWLYAFLC